MSARQPIRHGTAAGARTHYRRGGKPCPACLAADRDCQRQRRGSGDPYSPGWQYEPQGPPRNGLPIVAYQYRARRYRWAELAIRRAEAVYGRPDDELETAS